MEDDLPDKAVIRPFTLRDAMILVAAMAVGAMGFRSNLADLSERYDYWSLGLYYHTCVMLVGPGLAALTAGLAVIRLLSPRPLRIELFRQPGSVAAFVALGLTGWHFAESALSDQLIGNDGYTLADAWFEAIEKGGLGIVAAWSALALAGVWRGERGWVDRSLRFVALIWVVLGLAAGVVPVLVGHLPCGLP